MIKTKVYGYDSEIYHHGIKGMKWGVRRFQKKDGSLTSAGKKRYSDKTTSPSKPKKISAHRAVLEKKYRDSGMSEEEAKAAADKRMRVEKAIAISAGITVGACAVYYAKNKWVNDRCDQILKAGTTFHNLDSAANMRPGEHLYVNYRQNDVNYFRGHFAINKMKRTGSVFNHTITATDDIKIPSMNTRKSVFKQLYDNDPDFKLAFDKHAAVPSSNKSSNFTYKQMWMRMGDKDNPEFNVAKRKYFDALQKKGYDAIVDEWDTKKSVFRSDAPLILLNTSSKSLGEMSIKELSARDVLLSQANSRYYAPSRNVLNAMYTPHNNKFKESEKTLSRYAAKAAKNSEYIDKYLSSYKGDVKSLALNSKGSVIADAGKYMTKNKNMTMEKAYSLASKKATAEKTAEFIATTGIMTSPLIALSAYSNEKQVKSYIDKHPNTELTNKEILRMLST